MGFVVLPNEVQLMIVPRHLTPMMAAEHLESEVGPVLSALTWVPGKVFDNDFYQERIDLVEDIRQRRRMMHNAPIKAGLCPSAAAYLFSRAIGASYPSGIDQPAARHDSAAQPRLSVARGADRSEDVRSRCPFSATIPHFSIRPNFMAPAHAESCAILEETRAARIHMAAPIRIGRCSCRMPAHSGRQPGLATGLELFRRVERHKDNSD